MNVNKTKLPAAKGITIVHCRLWNMVQGSNLNWIEIGVWVAHKPITTLQQLLSNVKDKDRPEDRQLAVCQINCCNCQATHISDASRKRSMRQEINGDVNNHIAEHHLQMKFQIDWDSATCLTYFTDYYLLTLESWLVTLNKVPLNCSQYVPALYKRLIYRSTQAKLITTEWLDNRQLDLP